MQIHSVNTSHFYLLYLNIYYHSSIFVSFIHYNIGMYILYLTLHTFYFIFIYMYNLHIQSLSVSYYNLISIHPAKIHLFIHTYIAKQIMLHSRSLLEINTSPKNPKFGYNLYNRLQRIQQIL